VSDRNRVSRIEAWLLRQGLWPVAALVLLVILGAFGPALLPAKVILPYDPRLHRPFSHTLTDGEKAALLKEAAPSFGDHLLQFLPFDRFTTEQIRQGRLPLWNPQTFAGVCHPSQGTSQTFYPPSWFLALGNILWLSVLLFSAHLLAGSLALYAWLSRLGLRRQAALAGALLWALSPWCWLNVHHHMVFYSGAWVFLGLWGLERYAREGRKKGSLLALGGATALTLLAGFPQVSLMVMGIFVLYALIAFKGCHQRKGRGEAISFLSWSLASLAAGAALAAPHLLAMAEQAAISGRQDLSPETMRGFALAPAHMLGFFFPELLAPLRGMPYAGLDEMHPTYALLALVKRAPHILGSMNAKETWCYVGLLPLLLIGAALPRWKELPVALFLALPVLGLLVALGAPLLMEIWMYLPGGSMGDIKRILYLLAPASVVIAAFGLDRIIRNGRIGPVLSSMAALLGLLALAALLAGLLCTGEGILKFWLTRVAPLFAEQLEKVAGERPWWEVIAAHRSVAEKDFNIQLTRLSLIRFGLVGLAAVGTIWWARLSRKGTLLTAALGLGIGLTLADQAYTARRISKPVPAESIELKKIWDKLYPKYAKRVDQTDSQGRLIRLEASSKRTNKPELLTPNLPALLGMTDIQGYVPLTPGALRDLFAGLDPALDLHGAGLHSLSDQKMLDSPFLKLLRPRWLLSDIPVDRLDWKLLGKSGESDFLYEADRIMPLAQVIREWEVLPLAKGRVERLTKGPIDLSRQAIVESAPPKGILSNKGLESEKVQLLLERPGRIKLTTKGPGLLLLSTTWHPGWQAHSKEGPLEVIKVNHAFVGLWLPPGEQMVELHFSPSSVRLGLLLALLGLLGLGVLLFHTRGRHQREAL